MWRSSVCGCIARRQPSLRGGRNYNRAVIALASGLALLIGWYRGFNRRSLELAAAAFAVVLAVQTVGLIVTSRETGRHYWLVIALVAVGWTGAVWVGSRARMVLRP
jgi:ABC-type transport system involved in cytochrome c biogenesis permease subunit